jgi:hypothetical protein
MGESPRRRASVPRTSRVPNSGSGTGPRRWLEVPFEEKDAAKALGARWDPEARSWYAPPDVEFEPLARWTADLSSISGPFEKVQVLGLAIGCWKCDSTTVCVVGFLEDGRGGSFYDIVLADDDFRLSMAGRLLGDDRQRHRGDYPETIQSDA